MDKPRWDSWTDAVQEDSRTGRIAMKIGAWGEAVANRSMPSMWTAWTRQEAEQKLHEYLQRDVVYPTLDTTKPYKPSSGYLDEEYMIVVVICEPIQKREHQHKD